MFHKEDLEKLKNLTRLSQSHALSHHIHVDTFTDFSAAPRPQSDIFIEMVRKKKRASVEAPSTPITSLPLPFPTLPPIAHDTKGYADERRYNLQRYQKAQQATTYLTSKASTCTRVNSPLHYNFRNDNCIIYLMYMCAGPLKTTSTIFTPFVSPSLAAATLDAQVT